jgi:hypothetical protein
MSVKLNLYNCVLVLALNLFCIYWMIRLEKEICLILGMTLKTGKKSQLK